VDRGKALGQNWLQTGCEFCLGHYFSLWVRNSIITDNDTQFTREKFLDFCDDNIIWVDRAAVAHLRMNGQVEHVNGLILQGLKSRILTQEGEDVHTQLSTRAGKWVTEVPLALWSLRTMPNKSTNFTPFLWCMTRRSCYPSSCSMGPQGSRFINQLRQSKHGRTSSICSKSRGTSASQRSTLYQQSLRRYHTRKVHPRAFQVSDLVLHRVHTKKGKHKLSLPWEGPYLVAKVIQPRVYQLHEINSATFPNSWKMEQLRKVYT
jgi:hypothetical protein